MKLLDRIFPKFVALCCDGPWNGNYIALATAPVVGKFLIDRSRTDGAYRLTRWSKEGEIVAYWISVTDNEETDSNA